MLFSRAQRFGSKQQQRCSISQCKAIASPQPRAAALTAQQSDDLEASARRRKRLGRCAQAQLRQKTSSLCRASSSIMRREGSRFSTRSSRLSPRDAAEPASLAAAIKHCA
eukprot:Plantae.Rhodophyta-Hildenbrandia_rubra.ctg233.p4 GENE.Plantae.Rhodophyta-Hildenbrandia_rubra.ctg233~~Plantae.Rhodophyta-Hildenbrandia_rubra.ctg233.p4  ORF type:complete len:110 (-),score=2.03 Plantae.Rhodophyta-Hildenbrandia_rubra.ctg233:9553-9882(-)